MNDQPDAAASAPNPRAERERREAEDVPAGAAPTPAPQGVLELSDALEEHRMEWVRLAEAWAMLDDPEPVAQRLAAAGVSPTGVAESLRSATRNMQAVRTALAD